MPVDAENFARRIVERLQGAGHVAYFAGGCVRDRLMGRVPKDFDVATSARPEEVLKIFPRGQQVGAAFGVILLVEGRGDTRQQVEVATFRADGVYSDGRHPDSVRFTTAEEDARRRDFTCNGLFLDPLANGGAGALHDFVGGRADIAGKVLRAIGDAAARFAEDYLRMLRAVRFAAKLEFEIESLTRAAILRHATRLKAISRERIGEELRMILVHPSRGRGVQLLEELRLMEQIWPTALPETPEEFGGRIGHLPEHVTRALPLAALALDYGMTGAARPFCEALQQSLALANEERDEVMWLLEKRPILLDPSRWRRPVIKRLLADARWPSLEALHLAQRAGLPDAELAAWVAQMRAEGVAPDPFISGDTLISLGATPGPKFKGWLEELYDRQLEGVLRTQAEALAAARALIG